MRSKLVFVLIALCLLTGCAEKKAVQQPALPQTVSQWPENVYTMQIPRPENGVPDHVIDDSENGRYSVFLMQITEEQSQEYMLALKQAGYEVVQSAENEVSVGTILRNEDVYLSVSFSEGVLGIMISLQSE